MRKTTLSTALGGLVVLVLAGMATAATYQEIYPFTTIQAIDGTISLHQIATSEGNTGYSIVRGGAASPYHSYIVKVSDLGGTPTASALANTSGWGTGIDYILPGNTLAFVGNDLMFGDTRSRQVYKVDKSTGAHSVYLSKTTLQNLYPNAALSVSNGVSPAGEYLFYESQSDQILITSGVDSVSTLVSNAALTAGQGNADVSGGLTYDAAGDLYWGNNTNDALYKLSGGTISEVLSTAQVTAVTGGTTVGFGDIFYAPDGRIYFRDTSAKSILAFDPANPAGSLNLVLGQSDLESGPAGTAFVDPFSWCAGTNGIAFAAIGSGNKGYYAVPEPAAILLLGLGGLVLVRRRR